MPGGLEGAGALAVASPAGAQAQTDENEGEHGGGEEREQRQVLAVGAGDEVAELGGQRGQAVAECERVGGGRGGGRVAARVGGEQAVEARVLAVEELVGGVGRGQGWLIAIKGTNSITKYITNYCYAEGCGKFHINSFQFISIHFNSFQFISIHFNSFQFISIHYI